MFIGKNNVVSNSAITSGLCFADTSYCIQIRSQAHAPAALPSLDLYLFNFQFVC